MCRRGARSVKLCEFGPSVLYRTSAAPHVRKYGTRMTSSIDPFADRIPPRAKRASCWSMTTANCAQMLTEYLDAEHFEVKSVHDGGDALAALQTSEFEILILDVMLPSVGGFDVLRKLGASLRDADSDAHRARR